MRNENGKKVELTIFQELVTIRSFCSPEEIESFTFPGTFSIRDHSKSLYTKKESLIRDASRPDTNVVLALTADNTIIGFGVFTEPDPGDRWSQLGPGLMMEVRVIEVARSWRSGHLASQILELVLAHPQTENTIAFMVGYSWTWDLAGTGLTAGEYRTILIKLFSAFGFEMLETNEPNICLKEENLFMCRLGQNVTEQVIEQFNWLRFGIAPVI